MTFSQVKDSGGKIVPRSDLRVGTTREERMVKKSRQDRKIATWNVRTLLQFGKLDNLKIEMARMSIDILEISEVRWLETGDIWSGNYRFIYSGTSVKYPGRGGVGIMLRKDIGKKVKSYVQYSERIILVKIETKPKDTIIVQVYMPTSNSNDSQVEEVYEQIEKAIDTIKGEENLIIMGDWNAIVGEGKGERNIMGKYGLRKRNDRGDRLVEFCAKHDLIITNTCFNHHPRRRYTWKMPGDVGRYQIDFIMVKNRFKNQVKDSQSYPGADIDSDHNLVMMKCNLNFKKIKRRGNTNRWQTSKLKEEKVNEKFKEYTNKIKTHEEQDINTRWTSLRETTTNAATEIMKETKSTLPRKEWITPEIIEMIEERRKYKNLNTNEYQKRYRTLRNLIIRKSKTAKEKYLEGKCEEIDILIRMGKIEEAYKTVKRFFGVRTLKNGAIENKEGEIIYEQEQVVDRWKEYIETLYKEEELFVTDLEKINDNEQDEEYVEYPILREEFDKALRDLKPKKAPGIDGI
ncbi:craniofacial development protein 2-like [Sipha flava]|uniref:Craniofacial development protein 2-like n=1 Tax=Sipha flava TaxID=143950 RepID=A0A8B8GTT9_9HEMI|nr:craniofacial development protein 2-like [Sipha flava]